MSGQLEMCITQLEKELDTTRLMLMSTRSELDWTRTKLRRTMNKRLTRSKQINVELESESPVCEEYLQKSNLWEAQLAHLQKCLVFMGIHELSYWISMMRGRSNGDGKVVNYPTIFSQDMIVTSPLLLNAKRNAVASKYHLGPHLIPASVEVNTSPGVEMPQSQQHYLFCTRSHNNMFPDLSGKTVGNG
jgi:hypothetical protein